MALKVDIASYQKIEAHEVLFNDIRREVEAYMYTGKHTFRLLLLVKFAIYAFLLLTFYGLIFRVNHLALLLLLYTGMGYLLLLLGLNFAHDFAHSTIFRSRQLNNFLFEFLFLLMGVNGYLWKKDIFIRITIFLICQAMM
jgi:fatty acid desaturase